MSLGRTFYRHCFMNNSLSGTGLDYGGHIKDSISLYLSWEHCEQPLFHCHPLFIGSSNTISCSASEMECSSLLGINEAIHWIATIPNSIPPNCSTPLEKTAPQQFQCFFFGNALQQQQPNATAVQSMTVAKYIKPRPVQFELIQYDCSVQWRIVFCSAGSVGAGTQYPASTCQHCLSSQQHLL